MWVILTLHFNTLPLFLNLRNAGCKILKGIFYSTKKPVKLDIFISMYVNTTKAAKLLEISSSRLRQLLQERRVKGVSEIYRGKN